MIKNIQVSITLSVFSDTYAGNANKNTNICHILTVLGVNDPGRVTYPGRSAVPTT